MKIAVMGASGLIGTKVVEKLRHAGIEVVAASPTFGVNSVTGEGLRAAVAGADVVIDVTNTTSFGDNSALEFFKASTRNLLAASADAGIGHYLALSVVGTPRLVESDYFRAKMVQENLIRAARRPYTILHSTQFFEFISGVIDMGADGDDLRLPSASVRPIAADNVAEMLAELAMETAKNDTIEIGGPEQFGLDEIARVQLAANEDTRQVIRDSRARYYGVELNDDTLLPLKGSHVASRRYVDWLYHSMAG
ncbi:SDR family oxidoreductase [Phyllobacterium zundukense]|uniref:LysR family transcriptional regulator n=1 Tax=Phyllobacterium zundukense TaxID=1867719 RepID=A0A2N9W0E4_9HYPH|nr:NAD(P)H-binding protein [Phyllobacterium zundukense]ATU90549.1 LysR family transcriptional regulator [Phyllobacterium zundukense]PIO45212.1 LysR family transcriptional regulator [Phyllobacterium zundukense]